jgi:hypothetical protein
MIRHASSRKTVFRQERRVASDLGGKRQVGSGNMWHSKGDVTSRKYLIECKQTGSKSYGLSLQVLDKIGSEAAKVAKEPLLQVDFLRGNRIDSFMVVPYHLFLELIQGGQ